MPKELLLRGRPRSDKDFVIKTIMQAARTGNKGAFGDGKIFVTPVEEVYTVSSGREGRRVPQSSPAAIDLRMIRHLSPFARTSVRSLNS